MQPTILIILFAQVIATNMKTSFKDIAYTFIGIFYVVFFIMFVASYLPPSPTSRATKSTPCS